MTMTTGATNEGRVAEDMLRIGVLKPVEPRRPFQGDMTCQSAARRSPVRRQQIPEENDITGPGDG